MRVVPQAQDIGQTITDSNSGSAAQVSISRWQLLDSDANRLGLGILVVVFIRDSSTSFVWSSRIAMNRLTIRSLAAYSPIQLDDFAPTVTLGTVNRRG